MRRFLFWLIALYERLFVRGSARKDKAGDGAKKDNEDIYPLF
ncbi:MAG: hypothetical protein AB7D57_09695 [Desulfovibrionaceae bacterium]